MKKGEAAKEAIRQESKTSHQTSIEVWEVDLDKYKSVVSFSGRVRSQLPRLDGVVANAGIELDKFETSEECERTLTINVISTFLMALSILPKLKETAETYGVDTTLTIVGSMIHIWAPDSQLQVSDNQQIFQALSDSSTADMKQRYPLSKLIVEQCFRELAERYPASTRDEQHQVVINCVNPAWCTSELSRYKHVSLFERVMRFLLIRTSEEGSRTLVHA